MNSEPSEPPSRLAQLLTRLTQIRPHERRALVLAFCCNFLLLASYYVLRPVRDTVATVFGVDQLQDLFTGTFIGTLIASPLYALLASHITPRRLLPGVFWFWLANVLVFAALFQGGAPGRALSAAYYFWFSIMNLFMVSVFWTLMVDLFLPQQATRLFPLIAAGGIIGSIAGPLVTRFAVRGLGLSGLLGLAAAGFVAVIVLVYLLMGEKERLRSLGEEVQPSRLDHRLASNPFTGFREIFKSSISLNQAGFMLLMTWVNTVGYFLQTEFAASLPVIADRTVAISDINLWVNAGSAVFAIFGFGRYVQRFGVTAGLTLNPLLMLIAFVALALSPTLLMIQALQVVRGIGQYAIARPSREMCFTVVDQESRYKTKNIIDTLVYRLGDVSSAWILDGLRAAGLRVLGSSAVGFGWSLLWGGVALALGRRYEVLRTRQPAAPDAAAKAVVT